MWLLQIYPNAFAQTPLIKNDEEVEIIMVIRRKLADLLIEIAHLMCMGLWQLRIGRETL